MEGETEASGMERFGGYSNVYGTNLRDLIGFFNRKGAGAGLFYDR